MREVGDLRADAVDSNRPNNRPDPEDLATVLSRVDAMLSRLERGIPAAARPAGSRAVSRPAAPVAVTTPTPPPNRPASDFRYEGFEETPSPAARPLPRPVPAGPTVDFIATPRTASSQPALMPRQDSRHWLWTMAAIGLSVVAIASWWSALHHVANDGVRPLGPEELKALVW